MVAQNATCIDEADKVNDSKLEKASDGGSMPRAESAVYNVAATGNNVAIKDDVQSLRHSTHGLNVDYASQCSTYSAADTDAQPPARRPTLATPTMATADEVRAVLSQWTGGCLCGRRRSAAWMRAPQ